MSEAEEHKASKERASKSAKAVGRAAVEEAGGALLPVAGKFVVKGGLALWDHAWGVASDRHDKHRKGRVLTLLAAISQEGETAIPPEQVLEYVKDDPTEMLNSLIEAQIADEEAEKAVIYGRFYRGLLSERFPAAEQVKFLKAVKGLPYEAIQLLRGAVRREEEYRKSRARGENVTIGHVYRKMAGDHTFEVQQLVGFGLFYPKDGTKFPAPNDRGNQFILGLWPGEGWS